MSFEPETTMETTLLPVGYVDENGAVHRDVELHAMTGREDDLLAARGTAWKSRIGQVLTNCIDRIGPYATKPDIAKALRALPSTDRMWMLIRLRVLSLGDVYELPLTCPHCDVESTHRVMLSSFVAGDGQGRYERTITLPGGRTARWVLLGWEAESALEFLGRDESESKAEIDRKRNSITLFSRLVSYGDYTFSRDFTKRHPETKMLEIPEADMAALQGMPYLHRGLIYQEIKRVEDALLPLDFTVVCPRVACGKGSEAELELRDFFSVTSCGLAGTSAD